MSVAIQPEVERESSQWSAWESITYFAAGVGVRSERVSISYVTYCHAAALSQLHDVTLVLAIARMRLPCVAQMRRFARRSRPDAMARALLRLVFSQYLQIQLYQPGADRFRLSILSCL